MLGLGPLITFMHHVARHPAPLSVRANAVARFAYRQAHKRFAKASLMTRWEGLVLEVPADAHFAAAAYYMGRPDFWEFAFLERFLRPGDTVVDVGANVGVYALFLAKGVGPTGRVLACEPEPTNLDRLKRNIANNHLTQIELVESAIGARVGSVSFLAGQDTVGHMVDNGAAGNANHSAASTLEVPITTLDALCNDTRIAFIKVDVEGFEVDVLRGAQELAKKGMPLVWQLELELANGATPTVTLLKDAGYRFFTYDPVARTLVARGVRGRVGNNVLAIRDLDAVLERLDA